MKCFVQLIQQEDGDGSLRNVYLIIHQTDIETLRINLGRLLKISKFSMPAVSGKVIN